MELLINFLQSYAPWLIEHRYFFLFLGSLLEGMNTMVFGGFLASVGVVKILPLFLIMTLGHTLNGYIWYFVGFFGGAKALDKWGHRRKLSHEIIKKVTDYFNRYSGRAIMITKFTFSFQIATLILAGSLKHNLKNFSKYNFYGSFGWSVITIFIGYIFGQSYNLFRIFIKNLTYFTAFLAGAIILIILIKLAMRSAFIKSLRFEDKLRELNERWKKKFNGLMEERGK